MVSGFDDKTVLVWEKAAVKWECLVLTGHIDGITCVAVSSDGKQVVSGSFDNIALIWEKKEGKWKSFVLTGYRGEIRLVKISRDGKHVRVEFENGIVKVWSREKDRSSLALRDTKCHDYYAGWDSESDDFEEKVGSGRGTTTIPSRARNIFESGDSKSSKDIEFVNEAIGS